VFYRAASHAFTSGRKICCSPAPGLVPAALQALQEASRWDKPCLCFHARASPRFQQKSSSRVGSARGLRQGPAGKRLFVLPPSTNHQPDTRASVGARGCKHVRELGRGHLTQKVGPSSSLPVNKVSVHTTTPSDVPCSRCRSCFVKFLATVDFSL